LGSARGKFWLTGLVVLIILAFLPVDTHVSAPAILSPIGAAPIVSGDPALIDAVRVTNGQRVKAGDVLFELSAPELDASRAGTDARIAELEAQLARTAGDARDLADRAVLERQLASERATASGTERRRNRLVLRAPIDGIVTDLESGVHAGRWVGGSEALARIVTPGRYDIQAYVSEDDVWRVDADARGTFIPDDPVQASRPAKIVERAAAALQFLDQPMLASTNGGAIAVNPDDAKRLRPRAALYRMRFVAELDTQPSTRLPQPASGTIIISTRGTSMIDGLFRSFARIMRREASAS
jgi:putative peptide zinc metalloprotease protein